MIEVSHPLQGSAPTVVATTTPRPRRLVIYLHGWRTTGKRDVERYALSDRVQAGDVLVAPTAASRSRFGSFERDIIGAAQEALTAAGVPLPTATVIVAYSGAYSAASKALDDPRLSGVALLDATYGRGDEFEAALDRGLPMYVTTSHRSEDTQSIAKRLEARGAVADLKAPHNHDQIVPHMFERALSALRTPPGGGLAAAVVVTSLVVALLIASPWRG